MYIKDIDATVDLINIKVDKIISYQTAVYKNGHNTFKKSKYYAYEKQIVNQLPELEFESTAPLNVKLDLYFKIPVSWTQKKKNALTGTSACGKRLDVDNACKIIMDIISKYYGFDDQYVCGLYINKYWGLIDEEEQFNFSIENVL